MASLLDVINSHGKTSKSNSALMSNLCLVEVAACFRLVSHSQKIDCQGLSKDVNLPPLYQQLSPARSRKHQSSQRSREVLSENVLVVGVGTRHAGPKLPHLWDMYSAQFSPRSILITWQSGGVSWEGSIWSNSWSESGPKGETRDISRCFLQDYIFSFLFLGCCLSSWISTNE